MQLKSVAGDINTLADEIVSLKHEVETLYQLLEKSATLEDTSPKVMNHGRDESTAIG